MSKKSDRLWCGKYVIAIDVGTTQIKAMIYDQRANVVVRSTRENVLSCLQPGRVEIRPETLWLTVVAVLKECVSNFQNRSGNCYWIKSLGLSTMRNTFMLWNRENGHQYVDFITWKDTRSAAVCESWNRSLKLKLLQAAASSAYAVTRNKRYLAMSTFQFTTQMPVSNLLWCLENIPNLREDAANGRVMYGTIDTWLVWKLTGREVHATDPSNACVSGMFDPFIMDWSSTILRLTKIPVNMLPQVRDTNADYGKLDNDILNTSLPIGAVMGDQQAAMFGECRFDLGMTKVTLGTGSFLSVNTGAEIHSGLRGVYPVVGWKLRNQRRATYLIETGSSDTGTAIEWAEQAELFFRKDKLTEEYLPDSAGLCFVPAFSGLQAPFDDTCAATAFIGITLVTTKGHMMRSILESIAFRVKQLYSIIELEYGSTVTPLTVDGGVANNDLVVQMISDLIKQDIHRHNDREMSARGVAFAAGLSSGVWSGSAQLRSLSAINKVFHPRPDTQTLMQKYTRWKTAVERCLKWN